MFDSDESAKKALLGKVYWLTKHRLDNLVILIDYNKIQALSIRRCITTKKFIKKVKHLTCIA